MAKKETGSAGTPKETAKEKQDRIQEHAAASAKQRRKRLTGAIILTLYQFANNGLISGRQGGNVMMRNGRARKMTVPALVQNSYTQAQRASLGGFSSSWNALTQAQINAWNAQRGFFRSNRFGVPVEISGKTLYVALNQNLFNVGVAPISDPPSPTDVPGITDLISITATAGAGTIAVAYSPSPTNANVSHLVFATAGQTAGTSKPSKSAYRLIGIVPSGDATPFAAGAMYVAKFGAMTAGNKLFLKFVPVNETTGQAGPAIVSSSVIV